MCAEIKTKMNKGVLFWYAIALGLLTGYLQYDWLMKIAEATSKFLLIYLNLSVYHYFPVHCFDSFRHGRYPPDQEARTKSCQIYFIDHAYCGYFRLSIIYCN